MPDGTVFVEHMKSMSIFPKLSFEKPSNVSIQPKSITERIVFEMGVW